MQVSMSFFVDLVFGACIRPSFRLLHFHTELIIFAS